MKVLVIGSGGREHALVTKLGESPLVTEVFVAPGNAGMEPEATRVPIEATEIVKLSRFASDLAIDLTVVGPEAPLLLGISDLFAEKGMPIVGPSARAAEMEGSKVFAKGFMARHGIPTARHEVLESAEQGFERIDDPGLAYPVVLKADGLAQGKGVVVAKSRDEARAAIQSMMVDRRFGASGDRVVLEECLEGEEVSVFVLTDGRSICPLVPAQDHKRLLDGDLGPNTGGMGSFSPVVQLSPALYQEILRDVVWKTVAGLAAEGREYRGVMFVGLMLTKDGPRVLEYNVRLGDPEGQTVLARLQSDLVPLLVALERGRLAEAHVEWRKEAAVTVVLASQGYPGDPLKGKPIAGLAEAAAIPGVRIAHAGTRRDGDRIVTAGGRVLGVTGVAASLEGAVEAAYAACDLIQYEGKVLRRDVAQKGLAHLRGEA